MLKTFKQATLGTLKTSGVYSLVQNSRWRQRRLLILAYHGISLDDEHLWDYTQFMSPELFRSRMQLLKKSGCTVLPLSDALQRLYANDLPDKCVAITFDDGTADFSERAFPILREFDFPATLYLTTFYSQYNRPVFDVICSYLLWKGRNLSVNLNEITGIDSRIELSSATAREETLESIKNHARKHGLSAEEKDAIAATLARIVRVDYEELLAKRVLRLLQPEEVKHLAAEGVDIQLHTHRHRTPLDRELFLREIEDNRNSIREMTGTEPTHFCYPSGIYDSSFLPWLREAGVVSATTCDLGLASTSSNPLLLPRMLDISSLSSVEFGGWLSGVAAALPQRKFAYKIAG
jgi:peptidoglycan/xylan/chitin deacetylase (PgdA/CDA1 family)